MSAENYGIARSCGLGNKADLDECDLLEYYGYDDQTKSIFMYLESIKNPKAVPARCAPGLPEKAGFPPS